MKTFRPFRHAAWAATALLSLSLLGCGGCASPGSNPQPGKKAASGAPAVEFSPEAAATYAYLLYEQALRQDDEAFLLRAVDELAVHNPPAGIYMESAVQLLGRKSSSGVRVLEQGLKRFPTDPSLNLLYAEALHEQGRTEQALAHMKAYVAARPDSVDARLELALLLVKNDLPDEAEKLLVSIKGEQRTALVEYYHARALIGMRRENEAMRRLRKALKLMPDFAEAMAELAYIHEQRKELREAGALYEAILRHNDGAQEVLLRLIALSLRLNLPQKAAEFARKGPDTTAFKTTAAGMFVEARQYETAEPLLRSLLNAPDAPPDIYLYLAAAAYEGRKDSAAAQAWLEKTPPDSPVFIKACLLRVQLLADEKKLAQALDVLRAGQEKAPDRKDLRDMEIRLLAAGGSLSAAMEKANAAVNRWPDDGELAFLRASLLEESGDKNKAMQAMEDIVAKHPDHFQALNYVGYTLAEQNRDLTRALRLLHRAVELSPKSDYILDSLAWAQFRAGQLQAAWENINKAVEASAAHDPAIWEHYGDIAAALGKKPEARKAYYKALEFKPSNADSLRERLSGL